MTSLLLLAVIILFFMAADNFDFTGLRLLNGDTQGLLRAFRWHHQNCANILAVFSLKHFL